MTPISLITKDYKEPAIRSVQVLSPNLGRNFSELFLDIRIFDKELFFLFFGVFFLILDVFYCNILLNWILNWFSVFFLY